jgi:predicted PurR-regulated permease PerM
LQADLPPFFTQWIQSLDFSGVTTAVVSWLKDNLATLLAGGANFILQLFLFFAFLYYFLLHKDAIRREIFELSPFKDKLDQGIISRISATIRGVIVGAIIIAFIQATLAAIGLTIFGVPKGILWGSFALIAAQVPMVGVSLIMIPGILYLIAMGHTGAAIGLAIWSATVVGLVDNLLSPILVGRRTKMPELFVLISVLGGLQLFGPLGFVLGPVVLACVLVLRDLYRSGNLV